MINRTRLLTVFLWAFLVAPPLAVALEDQDYAVVNIHMVNDVVEPASAQFVIASQALADGLKQYCTADGAAVNVLFGDMATGWQRVQPIVFGPVMEGDGPSRFQFWPDRRGVGQKQRRAALAAEDASLLDQEALHQKSVALKDIKTLEALIYSDPELQRDSFACFYAMSVAVHQAGLAQELYDDWFSTDQGFVNQVNEAEIGSDHYYTADEVTRDFLKSIAVTTDLVLAEKLERPLGKSLEAARPKRSEYWRSGLSLAAVEANIETIRALFADPEGLSKLMQLAGSGALADGISSSMGEILEELGSINVPLREAITMPGERGKIEGLVEQLKTLRLMINGPVARSLDLIVGFNASDGD